MLRQLQLKKQYKQKRHPLDKIRRRSFPIHETIIQNYPHAMPPMKDEELMGYLSAADEAVTDTVAGDDPSCKKDPSSEAPLGSKDMSESSKSKDEQINQDPVAKVDVWKLYTDGASNDHGSRAGLILIDLGGMEYSYALRLNFNNSNNDAEYEALLAGLRVSKEINVKNIHAFIDSKLVASQVEGSYEARGEKTKKYQGKSPRGCHVLRQIPNKPHTKGTKQEGRCVKFRVPDTIIIDNGTQLINEPFKSWAEGLEIKVEKYYNQRVHHKQFRTREFVLGKNEVSKTESTGKLGPKLEGPYKVIEAYGTGAYKLRSMDGKEVPRTWHSSNL
ncbi:reverse transcriptase domain-containing protein [Tanacetum coccineum]